MTNLDQLSWHIVPDQVSLARDAADRIVRESKCSIGVREKFKIVLAGGTTFEHTYRHLARSDSDWTRWHIYFGDERCVPRSDPLRNSHMIMNSFLSEVAVPRKQINFMRANSNIDDAIEEYEKIVHQAVPFDLVLLGMGEDGHIASLFPGMENQAFESVVRVRNAPKEPKERISLDYDSLNNSRRVIIVISGNNKRKAVASWLAGDDLPISKITGLDGVDVYIDKDAYPE